MAADPSSSPQAEEPPRSAGYHYHDILTGTDPACDESNEQSQVSDRESHCATESVSNCTIVCGDRKWEMNKAVLCNNNEWFRAALEGPFLEPSTGEVIIEDTDPNMVQIVLDTIRRGSTLWEYSKPYQIVEIWKAGNFFGVDQLVYEAELAMREYLEDSSEFLTTNQRKNGKKGGWKPDIVHDSVMIKCGYSGCRSRRHITERRECPVRSVQPQTVLRLGDKDKPGRVYEGPCIDCHTRSGRLVPRTLQRVGLSEAEAKRARSGRGGGGPHLRIEDEIFALCDALFIATNGIPQGSQIQQMLIDHLCTTRVAMWGGFPVCRFLDV